MTTAFWCVLVAGLLPFAATVIAKVGGDRYNNRDPRAWLEKQQGFRKRAANAQANGFEAFPLFAAAVIVAHLARAPQATVDALALGFIGARVAYLAFYLADVHWARSLVWFAGLGICVALFAIGAG
jgi:uncharacterized MAPEG superfamily protein